MQIKNISEAKAQLPALIEKVMKGEDVIIAKAGKPVARIIRFVPNRQARKPAGDKGKVEVV